MSRQTMGAAIIHGGAHMMDCRIKTNKYGLAN
jgi:hypothetical protein